MFSLMLAEKQISEYSGGGMAKMGTEWRPRDSVWERQASVEHSANSVQ